MTSDPRCRGAQIVSLIENNPAQEKANSPDLQRVLGHINTKFTNNMPVSPH